MTGAQFKRAILFVRNVYKKLRAAHGCSTPTVWGCGDCWASAWTDARKAGVA